MNTKLTLSIKQEIIEKAKSYAKDSGRSLSDIIESYLKLITSDQKERIHPSSPITDKLRGSFKAPEDFDYKSILAEEKLKRHA